MLLATRCPFCETVFRIQPAQLAARRGLVRCGHCQEAFDASGSLFEVPDGVDFAAAVPVAADVAARLTTPVAAPAHVEEPARVEEPVRVDEPAQVDEPAEVVEPAHVDKPARVEEPAHVDDPAHVDGPAHADEPAHVDEPAAKADAANQHHAPLDFTNRIWDPWAPAPEGHVDHGLLYDAEHLPQPGLAPGVPARPVPRTRVPEPAEPVLTEQVAASAAPAVGPGIAPEPSTTPWRRVEPDLTEPTLSSNEATTARLDVPEPTLSRSAAAASSTASTASVASTASATSAASEFAPLEPADGTEPFALTREAPARAPRRAGWRIVGGLLALVLLVGFGAQLAWWLRESVMVYWPDSQPLYVQACEQLGCRVLPPRDIDGLQVEPSDLRQVDDAHHLELKVPLRNHFNVALAYPAIELTLLDRQNNVVVRRVLWPQDYVTPGTRVDAGLPARTTQTMIVRLDTGNVVASNFRIEIFYP